MKFSKGITYSVYKLCLITLIISILIWSIIYTLSSEYGLGDKIFGSFFLGLAFGHVGGSIIAGLIETFIGLRSEIRSNPTKDFKQAVETAEKLGMSFDQMIEVIDLKQIHNVHKL